MTKIEAVIRPSLFEDVKAALAREGVEGMTISEVTGSGRRRGQMGPNGMTTSTHLTPKVKIELVVPDSKAATLLEVIRVAAATGKVGDGKIWITHIDETIRIRTGERSESAV